MKAADCDIRFVRTDDGVAIAHWEIGSGPPLIVTHDFALSHAELEWTVGSLAAFHRSLARGRRVIRFDPRQVGMSDRNPHFAMTTTALAKDILTVATACEIERFGLMGVHTMGPVAIECAASYPDSVSSLILCDADVTVATSDHAKHITATAALGEAGVAEASTRLWLDIGIPEELDAIRELAVAAARPEDSDAVAQIARSIMKWDVAPLLERVQAPTLAIHSRRSVAASLDQSQRLAALIPGAQLKIVDGTLAPYFADQDAILEAIWEFLGVEPRDIETATTGTPFRTIAFTDVVASTELLSRLGDREGRNVMRDVELLVADTATRHSGRVVKNLGDGSLVSFASASGALRFAVELQGQVTTLPLEVRVGMAAGEPIEEAGDLHGAVVVQASRIADLAGPGEVLIADSIRQLVVGKEFTFESRGDTMLRGMPGPIQVWRVTGSG